jgi:hypothetical protein
MCQRGKLSAYLGISLAPPSRVKDLNYIPFSSVQKPTPAVGPSTNHSPAFSRPRSSSPLSVSSRSSKTAIRVSCCWPVPPVSADTCEAKPRSRVAEARITTDCAVHGQPDAWNLQRSLIPLQPDGRPALSSSKRLPRAELLWPPLGQQLGNEKSAMTRRTTRP